MRHLPVVVTNSAHVHFPSFDESYVSSNICESTTDGKISIWFRVSKSSARPKMFHKS